MKRFGNQPIRDMRAVVPRRVDEANAAIDDAPQHGACGGRIARLAPHHGSRQLHRTEADADHFLAADTNRCGRCREGHHTLRYRWRALLAITGSSSDKSPLGTWLP